MNGLMNNGGYGYGYGYGSYMPTYMRNPAFGAPSPSPASNGIEWAMGIENAKSVYVEPGKSKIIMDSEQPKFYIKTVDPNGMGSIKAFTFQEEVPTQPQQPQAAQPDLGNYVTKQELETAMATLRDSLIPKTAQPTSTTELPKTLI